MLLFQGPQLSQKTVTIRKTVRESLGMRIGGGIGSNEGDTPIYIANIHPHGCIGKSKQLKVGEEGRSTEGRRREGRSREQQGAVLGAVR